MKDLKDVVDAELPRIVINKDSRDLAKSPRIYCEDWRVATGRFYTDKEIEAYKKRVLSKPLP